MMNATCTVCGSGAADVRSTAEPRSAEAAVVAAPVERAGLVVESVVSG
jgi:hypothetical protein